MGTYNADAVPDLNKLMTAAFGYKLANQTNLKVDQFSTATSLKVYTFVRKIGSTRLKVLVDPALIAS